MRGHTLATRVSSVAWLCLLSAATACEDHSATAPDPLGPNVIRVVDPSRVLRDYDPAIRARLAATLAAAEGMLPITGVTITVTPDAAATIGGYGIGGRTPDAYHVNLAVDPAFPDLSQVLAERLPALCAHELHHAMRWRDPGYGNTLLEAMISEGLADLFSIELLGAPAPPWSDAFPEDSTAHYLDLARPEFDSTGYDHPRWFFEAGPILPRWTGYTLGFRLVRDYLAAHPGTTAAGLVSARADVFRP